MKRTKKPLVIGVTGIMGAGKSTVARVFEELGAVVIDADGMGRAMLDEPEIRDALADGFGKRVLGPDGRIDRAKLAAAAFASPGDARRLDALTREPLVARIRAQIEGLRSRAGVIVVDAALLPEWNARRWLDVLVTVDAEEGRARARLAAGARFSDEDARARMKHQASRAEKAGAADVVIPNEGSLDDLKARAREVYRALVAGEGFAGAGGKE